MSDTPIPPNIIQSAVRNWQRDGQSQWVEITGTSMWPLLRTGDQVLVNFGNDKLQLGQIAFFRLNNTNIIHRITRVGNDSITLRGDNRRIDDPRVTRQDIIGVVITRKRFGRKRHLTTISGQTYSNFCRRIAKSKLYLGTLLRTLNLRK